MLVEDGLARGLSESEARAAAQARMGDIRAAREACIEIDNRLQRRETVTAMWDTITQDVRLAARTFGRNKLWTALAVLTLGLGIGATSALFSIVNAVLLRPLPFPDPDRIVSVTNAFDGKDALGVPEPTYRAWKERAKSFSVLAASRQAQTVLKGAGDPEIVTGRVTTYGYFQVFGLRPLLGRVFTAEEDQPGSPRMIVLSEQIWRRLYNADSSIVGRTILMDQNPATVIGVMPAAMTTKTGPQYWLPYRMRPSTDGSIFYTSATGRLAPGASLRTARAELEALLPPPSARDSKVVTTVVAITLHERRFGDTRPTLLMLFAAVGVLLLIACANVANLLLARAMHRQREFAVRAAIGASSWRLVRFTLAESTLLSLIGAAAGLVIAWLTLGTFIQLSPPTIAGVDGVAIDVNVIAFAIAVAVITGITFGLIPALQVRRVDVHTVLSSSATRISAGRRQGFMRRALVVAELATALVLVTGAGLLMKSFARVTSIEPGIDASRIVVAGMNLSRGRYKDYPAVRAFYDRFITAIAATPGVEGVSVADAPPLGGSRMSRSISENGKPGPRFDISAVDQEYFRTTGLRVVGGRAFAKTDAEGSEPVAILNETAARMFGKGMSVVGERLPVVDTAPTRIIGIVRDILQHGVEEAAPAIVYVPLAQFGGPSHYMTILARTSGDPKALVPAIRDLLRQIDPLQPLPELHTLEQQMSDAVAPRKFTFTLLTVFASIGALLAMIGLYGVMSFLVEERTNEIGVRVALGADAQRIMRYVVGEGVVLVACGVMLGLAGSLAAVRVLRTMLFQVSVYDPSIFVAGAVLLVGTAMVACALPARRAAALDPVDALRAG
jgi:putative ABC transport system permease protein